MLLPGIKNRRPAFAGRREPNPIQKYTPGLKQDAFRQIQEGLFAPTKKAKATRKYRMMISESCTLHGWMFSSRYTKPASINIHLPRLPLESALCPVPGRQCPELRPFHRGSSHDFVIGDWDHEPLEAHSADWQSAVSRIGNPQFLPVASTLPTASRSRHGGNLKEQ